MIKDKLPASYRIAKPFAEILERLSDDKKQSSSMVLEMLVLKVAIDMNIIMKDSPNHALFELFEKIDSFDISPQSDYTLKVFEQIMNTDAINLWKLSTFPDKDKTANKRKQFVNQRIGRFCKKKIGRDSDVEVTLPKNSKYIIKGYTKLKPV